MSRRPGGSLSLENLQGGAALTHEDTARIKGRGNRKARARELDAVPIMNINFRLERDRAAKLKAYLVENDLIQEEFFDELLRKAGF